MSAPWAPIFLCRKNSASAVAARVAEASVTARRASSDGVSRARGIALSEIHFTKRAIVVFRQCAVVQTATPRGTCERFRGLRMSAAIRMRPRRHEPRAGCGAVPEHATRHGAQGRW
jgi:hypothetical protein